MKISLNMGHTLPGQPGSGAVFGKYNESNLTRLVGKEVSRLLKSKGHTVYDCTVDKAASQNEYLKKVVQMSNAKASDLFVSIHFNCSSSHQGHGVETYTWNGKKHDEAVRVCYELSALGFKNRGVRSGNNLYVVKNTKAKAILIEVCFIDNPTDQTLYSKLGVKGIAKAIADAIV